MLSWSHLERHKYLQRIKFRWRALLSKGALQKERVMKILLLICQWDTYLLLGLGFNTCQVVWCDNPPNSCKAISHFWRHPDNQNSIVFAYKTPLFYPVALYRGRPTVFNHQYFYLITATKQSLVHAFPHRYAEKLCTRFVTLQRLSWDV